MDWKFEKNMYPILDTRVESEDDNITPIKRIGNVFKKLFDFIKSFMSGK